MLHAQPTSIGSSRDSEARRPQKGLASARQVQGHHDWMLVGADETNQPVARFTVVYD
jgi:hypothetical protein